MPKQSAFKILLMLALGAILFSGCRAEERDRFVRYEPGIYKGQEDTELSEKQRRQLRLRSKFQGSGMTPSGGGSSNRNVRIPGSVATDLQALKSRIRLQSGSGTN